MKTETLIKALVRDAAPVKRIDRPLLSFFKWAFISAVWMGLSISLIGKRSELLSLFHSSEFILSLISLLILTVISAFSAFRLSIPDRRNFWWSILPASALGVWSLLIFRSLYSTEQLWAGSGINCIRNILVLSILPFSVLYFILKRSAPLHLGQAGLLATLASAALANLGTRFICQNDNPFHIFIWHYLPVGVLACLGILLGKKLLKPSKKTLGS